MSTLTRSWHDGTVPSAVQWAAEFDFLQPIRVQITGNAGSATDLATQKASLRVLATGAAGENAAKLVANGAGTGGAALALSALAGLPGWMVGQEWNDSEGAPPIAPGGTLFKAVPQSGEPFPAANGMDLRNFAFTGNAFASNGFAVDGQGNASAKSLAIAVGNAPATASSPGTAGMIALDANYLYVCVASNTWHRVTLTTW